MKTPNLEVNYRQGRILAAYYCLPRETTQKVHHSKRMGSGLVVDFDAAGTPMGIEITAPELLTIEILNDVLVKLGIKPADQAEFAPLLAA